MCKRIHLDLFLPLSFVLTLTWASAETAKAQNQCTQKLSSLPAASELYGFRLGMTKDEVKALVPQTKFGKTDDFGVAKTTINPSFDPTIDKDKFASVRSISLDFLDERLTSLWIGYDETYKARTVDEFIKQISQSLQLAGSWTTWRSRGQQLRCQDFQVIVSAVAGGPTVRILDVAAEDLVAARRVAKEEEKEGAEETARPDGAATEPASIVGDRTSKTYYSATCKPPVEIPEKDRVLFKSVEEAEKNGYKLAKTCN